jgi:hypothetical protein
VQPTSPSSEAALPPLAEFLRWLAEMPEAFRSEPSGFPAGKVPVPAVVADLHETLFASRPEETFLAAFRPGAADKVERNRLRWVLAACHLLWHPALRAATLPAEGVNRLLVQDLAALAAVAPVDGLLRDEERREELVRRTLHALGLLLPGESPKEAEDRLTQVDSVERRRLVREAAEKEKRAREVREQMARRAAEEAAAKVSRE